jgi:hypothetical protein
MHRTTTLATAVALACGACQPLPDATLAGPAYGQPQPAYGEPQPAPVAGAQPPAVPPTCSSYTVPLTVGGQPQQAVVEACQKADGSWRITQTTPGLPPQVYEAPAPAPSPYPSAYTYPGGYPYPDFSYYWDWSDSGWGGWGGGPWFVGLAPSIVVVQRFKHFPHGFHHGFAHGFGHGFAGMHGGGMAGGHR